MNLKGDIQSYSFSNSKYYNDSIFIRDEIRAEYCNKENQKRNGTVNSLLMPPEYIRNPSETSFKRENFNMKDLIK